MWAIKNNAPVKPTKAIDKSAKHTQKAHSCSSYYNTIRGQEQQKGIKNV